MTYFNEKSKSLEVNTSLMLYKSLIRSITEYSNFVYYYRKSNQKIKLGRA